MELYSTREVQDRVVNEQYRTEDVNRAADMGIPYSAYIDLTYDPHKDGEISAHDEGRTGFEVVSEHLDMTTECNPAAGVWPTSCEEAYSDPAKRLALKEMMLNTHRSISYYPYVKSVARQTSRREQWERAGSINFIHDTPPGSTLTPFYDAMAHWDEDVDVDIRLEELTTRMADTNKKDYRATIMEYDKDAFRMERTAPGSNPPMAKFGTTEWSIQPLKRRLGIPFDNDFLMDVEFIDKALEHVEQIAVQQIMAKVDEGLETMLFGAGAEDLGAGRERGPQIVRLQDLDESATDSFTPNAWLALQKKFQRTYMLTSCIAPDNDITNLQLSKIAGTNVMLMQMIERENAVSSGFGGGFEIMNQLSQGIRVGWHDYLKDRILETKSDGTTTVKHNACIVYDKRKGVEFVSKMNSDIMESTRDILKDLEYIVCAETWGWISYQPKRAIYVVVMGNPASDSTLSIVKDTD